MEDVIVKFTSEQFVTSSEPYDYLAGIENPLERDREIAAYRKFAQKNCGITAGTFKEELRKAETRIASNKTSNVSAVMTEFPDQPISLRCPGYLCNETGIWVNAGLYGPVCVCPQPILPIRRITNYDTGERKMEIAFRDKGVWRTMIVPRSVLAAANRIVQPLSERGVFVDSESAKALVTYFTRIDAANSDILPETHSATRLGWIDKDKFLPFEDSLIFDGATEYQQMYQSIHEHGDRQKWFDLAMEVRKGNSLAARTVLAASFASVLIKPLRKLPFFVHIWSDTSGTGKTVGMMLATSVWACPEEGAYWKNMNTTNVGIEATSGFLGSLPLCLDELCMKDSKGGYKGNLEEMVYQFCEGTGRTRGSRDGGLQRLKQWNCCAITTGETPLIKTTARAGAVNRVLEIDHDSPLFTDLVRAANTLRDNYGFAGKVFVEALLQDGAIDRVRQWQDEYFKDIVSSGRTTEKQAMVVSVILAADRFAALHVFDDANNLRVDDLMPMTKTLDEVDTNKRAYDWLMSTIQSYKYLFEPGMDEKYTRDCLGRLDETSEQHTVACIHIAKFEELMTKAGYDPTAFRKWAKKRGLIKCAKNGETARTVRMNGIKEVARCVCVRMNALEDYEEHDEEQNEFTKVDLKKEDIPF